MKANLLGGRVSVSVQPFFLLMVVLFGASLGRNSPGEIALWTAVVAFSVLVHESGHAAVCLAFGSGADVTLHGFGGSTRPRDPSSFGTWKAAALDLAGCAAGAALAAASFGALHAAGAGMLALPRPLFDAAAALVQVNVWFSLFNLLPVAPLDGGKLVQGLLGAGFGVAGRRAGHALGFALGGAAALWFFSRDALYGAFLCGALALGEARALREALSMTAADADPGVRAELGRAAELWSSGRRDDAAAALAALRARTGAGLTHAAATLQLAYYLSLLERDEESLALFKTAPESGMSPAAKRAYADVARRRGDYALALRLGRTNFHDAPGPRTAAAAAVAAAGLGDARETVAWLRTALRKGLARAELDSPEFDGVRSSAEFREFVADLDAP
ncbi:MAG: site-2 protease family protein [Elusimicrobiota bacterium]